MTVQDWINALLSGNYSQTKHRLRDRDGFCCLGVACDIKNPLAWGNFGSSGREGNGMQYWLYGDYKESHCLPISLQNELGLDEDTVIELADMNDKGRSFAEIAERIKEYVKKRG